MNDFRDIILQESFAKIAETQQRILDSVRPALQFQDKMREIIEPISNSAASFQSMIVENNIALNGIQQKLAEITANTLAFHLDDALLHIPSLDISSIFPASMQKALESVTTPFFEHNWPTLEWLNSFDYSPIAEAFRQLAVDSELIQQFTRLNNTYQQALYESKWFPYPGWLVNRCLLQEICEILVSSRGPSKRREQRIDRVVLSYYTDKEIKRIRKAWSNSNLDHVIRKTLCQSIDAFLRKEYALSIATLATMWDGLIYIKANNASAVDRQRRKPEKIREDLEELIQCNGYELIPSDYFKHFISSQCNSVEEVIDGVPNRNGVAHGWYKKYPNRKAALNAILLTDFIVLLEPIEK